MVVHDFDWQTVPVVVGTSVVVLSGLYFLLRGDKKKKKKKLPQTLQDSTVKYPLPLIEKEVRLELHVFLCMPVSTCFRVSMILYLQGNHSDNSDSDTGLSQIID